MERKLDAANFINEKLKGNTFLTYKEIADITGYHPKYILKLKKEIIDGSFSSKHGNTNREPINKISQKEKEYIINLYKRSNASVRKFCQFYNRRSYSCVYNILKEAGLLSKEN